MKDVGVAVDDDAFEFVGADVEQIILSVNVVAVVVDDGELLVTADGDVIAADERSSFDVDLVTPFAWEYVVGLLFVVVVAVADELVAVDALAVAVADDVNEQAPDAVAEYLLSN